MQDQTFTAHYEDKPDLFQEPLFTYANFWQRFFAILIDGFILIIPSYIFNSMFGPRSFSAFTANIILGWLYESILTSSNWQATIGKRALRIKIIDMQGQKITFGQATGRHFAKILSFLIVLIGYFMMLWDEQKQTLHDKMAGTLVVEGQA